MDEILAVDSSAENLAKCYQVRTLNDENIRI